MIKAIAIDDEPLALELIKNYVNKIPNFYLLDTFTNTQAAKDFLAHNEVDLLFLDIHMPEISGIDFYHNLSIKPLVIFTTAYSQYAVEAFNINADDYLLKPFDLERFEQAIQKVRIKLQKPNEADSLLVKYDYLWTKIPHKNILFIEALDDYIKIITEQKSFLIRMSMKAVLEKLPPNIFIRIHRSYIVHKGKVDAWTKNTLQVAGRQLPISTSYQKNVLSILG